MILYYALGGGLGHTRRAVAVVHTLGLEGPVVVVSASPHAEHVCNGSGTAVVCPPLSLERDRAGLRAWVVALLRRLRPRAVYIDAFPAGVLGEWCGVAVPAGTRVHHVARLLRWDRYRRRLGDAPPRFDHVHVLEPLGVEQQAFIEQRADVVEPLALSYPPAPDAVEDLAGSRDAPRWLVVHSGPDEEIRLLLAYAQECARAEGVEPALTLVSPSRPDGVDGAVVHRSAFPAAALFPQADRIVSACGFNTMWETRPFRARQRFLPFPRALDDQHLRARRVRAEVAAQRSTGPDQR